MTYAIEAGISPDSSVGAELTGRHDIFKDHPTGTMPNPSITMRNAGATRGETGRNGMVAESITEMLSVLLRAFNSVSLNLTSTCRV